ncbi:type IX secretion system membrane protein PorP/SprF [uncultured Croceitalea sp.]|uniref:PorP/SprF family type IX secretion system membrane protein n=1 Tax=uncultured Croceitalea sp. TaxID=1798908 RepID=UPI0033067DBD
MKKIAIILFLKVAILFPFHKVISQQDAMYTQYMYNTNIINPAYAGVREMFNITAFNRTQWINLDGAPQTQTLNINTPIGTSGLGLGISLVNDKIGPVNEQLFNVDTSYKIQVSRKNKLAFGIKTGFNLLNANFNELQIFNSNDSNFEENIEDGFSPNLGAGIYYFSDQWYLGMSIPNILETEFFNSADRQQAGERRTFYFISGYDFNLNHYWRFKPAILTRIVSGSPISTDISTNFLYHERFAFGASYRFGASISALAGFQINEAWFLGYSYDLNTQGLGAFNNGSHEIFMRFEFNWFQSRKASCNCPIFF